MLRIKFGEREWRLDEDATQTMGDIVAMRDMGLDPSAFGRLLAATARQIRTGNPDDDLESLAVAEACAQIAFLAEVRENHHARWRDFVFSLPLDDLRSFDIVDESVTELKPTRRTSSPVSDARKTKRKTTAKPKPAA